MHDKPKILRKKQKKRILLLVLGFVLSIVVCCVGWYWGSINQPQERGKGVGNIGLLHRMEYQSDTYIEKTALTVILLMGIDKAGNTHRYSARQGGQADFLLVCVVDHENRTVYQLQIDRDTITDVTVLGILGNKLEPRPMQICLSHGFGDTAEENNQNTVDAIQRLLMGISIDYYFALNLESIGILNDLLGGVTVTLTDDFSKYDPMMVNGATVKLNGMQAEIFTRYRAEVGDGSNESRMTRQRAFISAAGTLLKEQIANKIDFIDELYAMPEGIFATNMAKGRLFNELNMAYQYDILPVETLPGNHTVNDEGFMEFYTQEDAITQWILRAFYKPADRKQPTN